MLAWDILTSCRACDGEEWLEHLTEPSTGLDLSRRGVPPRASWAAAASWAAGGRAARVPSPAGQLASLHARFPAPG